MIVQPLSSVLSSSAPCEEVEGSQTPWLKGSSELRAMFPETSPQGEDEAAASAVNPLEEIAKGKAELAATIVRYSESISLLNEAARSAGTTSASEIVDTALVIAQALLGRELGVDRAPLLETIKNALTSIHERPIVVRVHAGDLELIQEANGDFSEQGVRLVSDQGLSSGECIVESLNLSVDSTVASRLAAARDALVDLLASEEQDAE